MKAIFGLLLFLAAWNLRAHEYHFRLMPAEVSGEIRQINLLFQSSDKLMWLGTDRGLYSFDGRKYKYFIRPDRLLRKITALTESTDGMIWAGYDDGYLMAINFMGETTQLDPERLIDTTIRRIVFHPNGHVYIATYGKGLFEYAGHVFHQIKTFASETINDALLAPNGQLWVATDNGILIYDPATPSNLKNIGIKDGLPDELITHLTLDKNGDVLIGMYDLGVCRYAFAGSHIELLFQSTESEGPVHSIEHGLRSEIWMATKKSIWYVTNHSSHRLAIPFPLKQDIETILFDNSGSLWMSSGNRLFVANTQIEYVYPDVSDIQAVLCQGDQLWIGTAHGLFSTDKEGLNLKAYLASEKINVLSLYRDQQGLLWIGTFGEGLYIFDPSAQKVRHLSEKEHLFNTSILNIDGKGNQVWLATLGGITQMEWSDSPFEKTLKIKEIADEDQSAPGYVYDVYVADDGNIWFGTDGKGLFYLKNDDIHSFLIHPGQDSTEDSEIKKIYSITEDWEHRLWLSTALGKVVCIDKSGNIVRHFNSSRGLTGLAMTGTEEVLMISEGAIHGINKTGNVYVFEEASGLSDFVPINLSANSLDSDGTIWITDADALLHYASFNPIYDRDVKLHFEEIVPYAHTSSDRIVLKPDSNFLDIKFTGIWYQDPTQVRYRYKLDGHDLDWIYTREGRAIYSRLSPGTYTFMLQGSQNDDFEQSKTLQKTIIVLPPFYLRWWFIVSLALLIGFLVYQVIRSRFKRIRKYHELEKEKTTHQLHAIQAQVNPHFLFNSFNTLSSIIEEDQQAAVDYVDQLSSFFRGALMHRDDELISISEELEIVRNYVYILRKRYGENIRIVEDISPTTGWVAPLSIQLLIENAIKHNTVSSEKKLTIHIHVDAQWIEVSNPLQPKFQILPESTGFGLTSLVTRYTYLTPLKIEIRKEQNNFIVRIPIIYKEKAA